MANLQVGCHDPVGAAGPPRQFHKDAVENTYAVPTDEPVVDRLVQHANARRIAPPQAILVDEDDCRDNKPVIDTRNRIR